MRDVKVSMCEDAFDNLTNRAQTLPKVLFDSLLKNLRRGRVCETAVDFSHLVCDPRA